jgi:hypothetical protein
MSELRGGESRGHWSSVDEACTTTRSETQQSQWLRRDWTQKLQCGLSRWQRAIASVTIAAEKRPGHRLVDASRVRFAETTLRLAMNTRPGLLCQISSIFGSSR